MRYLISLAFTALAAGLLLSGCAGGPTTTSTVTRSRLERSLETTYANRYVELSKLLGHGDVTVESLDAHAVCDKGGPTVADRGPGGDWICQVAYDDPNIQNPDGSAKVEMNVHSNDCYTGISTARLVGPLNIVDTHGHQAVNPVSEFDGCFDPASSDTPDGTLLIVNATRLPGDVTGKSALTLPTGLVDPDSSRRVDLPLACAPGSDSCTGSIDVTVQGQDADTISYDVPPGATRTVSARLTARQVRDGGIITLTADEKTPPPTPT
ncbi:MAG: hypothetical protein JWM86_994 [Thermoleophilia bacterium]|nr:hypothetical protein [Thermoleophilia bacterium]